jgi:hypothetical protein
LESFLIAGTATSRQVTQKCESFPRQALPLPSSGYVNTEAEGKWLGALRCHP